MSLDRLENRKKLTSEVSYVQRGSFEVDGEPLTWTWDHPRIPFLPFHGTQEEFQKIFSRELVIGQEADRFLECWKQGKTHELRKLYLEMIAYWTYRYSRIFFPRRTKQSEKRMGAAYQKADFYTSLASLTGLVSIQEVLRIFSVFHEVESREYKTHKDRETAIAQEVKKLSVRPSSRRHFATPEQIRETTSQLKKEAWDLGKEVTTCVFTGTFRPFHPIHAMIGELLKMVVDRVVWAVTDDEAYLRMRAANEKKKTDFTAKDAMNNITSFPCFGENDDICTTHRLLNVDGVDEVAQELWTFGCDYVYVGAKSEHLYFKRVKAAGQAGAKIISGPDVGWHGSDIRAEVLPFVRLLLDASNFSREQLGKLFPELVKWTPKPSSE